MADSGRSLRSSCKMQWLQTLRQDYFEAGAAEFG